MPPIGGPPGLAMLVGGIIERAGAATGTGVPEVGWKNVTPEGRPPVAGGALVAGPGPAGAPPGGPKLLAGGPAPGGLYAGKLEAGAEGGALKLDAGAP